MPSQEKAMVDVRARVAQLERRRVTLLSAANAATAVARTYERIMAEKSAGARSVYWERSTLAMKYRELRAGCVAEAVIAKAQARWLLIEICALRAISGESLQGTQR